MVGPDISIQTLLVLAGAVLLGIAVLTFLQKKVKIFTRGTVTFMVIVVMTFAIGSAIDMANEIKIAEQRAKRIARNATVVSFLKGWLLEGPGGTRAAVIHPNEKVRESVERELGGIEATVSRELGCCDGRLEGLTVVAIQVADQGWTTQELLGRGHQWEYDVVFDDGKGSRDGFVCLRGRVYTRPNDKGVVDIIGIDGKVDQRARGDKQTEYKYARLFRLADYQNPGYEYSMRQRRIMTR